MPGYGTIIVTTDLSDPSLSALKQAVRIADASSSLVLVYVVEDRLPPLVMAQADDIEALVEQHRERAEKALTELAEKHLPGKNVDTVVRTGSVHHEVAQLARQRAADLIVIGMHGHGYLVHALAGSTTERVLHHAPCPVLVVPHS